MAEIAIIKLRVRRGSDFDRRQVILDNGELGYVTDRESNRLVVGDSVTPGGHPIGAKFYAGSIGSLAFRTTLRRDIVYNTKDCGLYVLTGTDFLLKNQYLDINPKRLSTSITANSEGRLTLQRDAVSANNIYTDAFDKNFGFKEAPNGQTQVNNDNASIKINIDKQLYVDPRDVDWSNLPTTFTQFNKMWRDPTAGNVVRIGPQPGIYPIELNVTWNTCGRTITAYTGGEPVGDNQNDRPRINTFRTDSTFLTYMSAGFQVWDPVTKQFYTPWGDRTVGSLGQTIILNSQTLSAGVDVFAPIDMPITLVPDISQWTQTINPLVPEEVKYQLLTNTFSNPINNITINFC